MQHLTWLMVWLGHSSAAYKNCDGIVLRYA
jgi:hypothetical protein